MTRVTWSARCGDCDWTATGTVRNVDLAANRHSAKGGHPTMQEGVAT